MAYKAPMTRPNPQFIQQAIVETNVTATIACNGVLAIDAKFLRSFLKSGAFANTWPVKRTRHICIENASRLQKLFCQCKSIARGV